VSTSDARTIAITGAASGIGLATARRLEAQGTRILGIDVRGATIVADLSTRGGRAAATSRVREMTSERLDGLVACAGVGPTGGPPALIVSVNYFGAVELLDGLRSALATGRGPAAVAVLSNSATAVPAVREDLVACLLDGDEARACALADGLDGTTAYVASKLALGRAMRRRAPEWARAGVRLNGIAPGPIDTPLLRKDLADPLVGPLIKEFPVPLGGFGRADDMAAAIDFLLGPQSAFCAGSILYADGGTDALVRPDRF
jgi:NAD(P)-dependent dehydrogenase (short-subunit alcohol dehydrogenase family)